MKLLQWSALIFGLLFGHVSAKNIVESEAVVLPQPEGPLVFADGFVASMPSDNASSSATAFAIESPDGRRRTKLRPRPRPHPGRHHYPGPDAENALLPYLRYMWWLVVIYLFWAQSVVCDEYFVPTICAISERCGIPDDIAGATIMALGCNGPELFINTVSMFKASDLGIGAVMGGEVFNLLVLCGCALLATPCMYMPLRMSKLSFSRDVLFYALSIGLIYWVLADNAITLMEAIVLLLGGTAYSTVVGLSGSMRVWLIKFAHPDIPSDLANSTLSYDQTCETATPGPDRTNLASNLCPEDGCFLGVRVQMANRMADRYRHWDTRFVTLSKDGLLVTTDVRDLHAKKYGRTSRGIVFQRDSKGDGQWCHGGLVNAPTVQSGVHSSWTVETGSITMPYRQDADGATCDREELPSSVHIPRCVSDPAAAVMNLKAEKIAFHDVVRVVAPLNPQLPHFELQVVQRDSTLGKVITLEFDAKSVEMRDRWISAIKISMHSVMRADQDSYISIDAETSVGPAAARPRVKALLLEWVEWFQFPVKFLLRVTIPDVKNERWRRYMPLSFVMSMFWLAMFSFCVVEVCDIIAYEFKISVAILGFTVAAIGTSFPNVISCIAVSRQGKTGMAIANALGANIQNVFIALALPWFFKSLVGGSFEVAVADLSMSVMWMCVTLVLLVLVVLVAGCKMPKWSGVFFLVLYVTYLVFTIGEEFACPTWPVCST